MELHQKELVRLSVRLQRFCGRQMNVDGVGSAAEGSVVDVGVVVMLAVEEEAVVVDLAGDVVVLLVVVKDLEAVLQVAVDLVEVEDAALHHTGSTERRVSMVLDELMDSNRDTTLMMQMSC